MQTRFYGVELVDSPAPSTSELRADAAAAFAILKPKPAPAPLIAVGPSNADGAYLLPDDLDGVVACFSPGVSNRKDFEDDLTVRFGIDCHLCDRSSDIDRFASPLIEGRQSFRKLWLDLPGVADSVTLDDWVAELAPATCDLLLQMDIEGAEYRNILSASRATLQRFRILVLELHGLNALSQSAPLRQVVLPFLRTLERDFICVHAHPNNCCGEFRLSAVDSNIPKVIELTFLRRDRFTPTTNYHAVLLPHPLDVSRNVPSLPPLFLSDAWLEGPRPLASRVKMLEDQLAFEPERAAQARRAWQREVNSALTLTARAARTAMALPERRPAPPILDEVAIGRPYRLSSAWPGQPKGGLVPDGSPNFFFHTALGCNERIVVELAQPRLVRSVTIANRRDACFDRAQWLFAIFHEHELADDGATFLFETPPDFETGRLLEATLSTPPVLARFITILSAAHTALHFSALRVMAEPTFRAGQGETGTSDLD